MKDATEVNEKDLKAAIVALNATGMLEEKIVVKGKTVEDLMEALLDGVEELDEAQQSTLPATVINVYNDLIADEVESKTVESEKEEEVEPETPEPKAEAGKEEDPSKGTKESAPKAKKDQAPTPKKEKKEEEGKKESSSNFAMRFICDDPQATEVDIQKALDKAGLRILSTATIDYLLKEVGYIIGYLKESKRIK